MDVNMDLILWRHAEAIPIEEGLTDAERPLTHRGERQAARMAQWLERQLPDGAKVLCSPTVRTQQTVLPLGRKFKLRDEIAPQGTVEHALELAQWPTAKATIVMVSHQPLIGQLVSHLLGLPAHEMMIKKGSVWWLRYKLKEGIPQVSLLTVQSPELL
jgi:phosphohistidine phosphatase